MTKKKKIILAIAGTIVLLIATFVLSFPNPVGTWVSMNPWGGGQKTVFKADKTFTSPTDDGTWQSVPFGYVWMNYYNSPSEKVKIKGDIMIDSQEEKWRKAQYH